jgi:hypothetical protein
VFVCVLRVGEPPRRRDLDDISDLRPLSQISGLRHDGCILPSRVLRIALPGLDDVSLNRNREARAALGGSSSAFPFRECCGWSQTFGSDAFAQRISTVCAATSPEASLNQWVKRSGDHRESDGCGTSRSRRLREVGREVDGNSEDEEVDESPYQPPEDLAY